MAKSPYGECARCGFKFRLNQLHKEWSGSRVCKGPGTNDCFDPKPAELSPPRAKPEGVPLPNAAPAADMVFAKFTDGSHL
jgi:hypothetical protein